MLIPRTTTWVNLIYIELEFLSFLSTTTSSNNNIVAVLSMGFPFVVVLVLHTRRGVLLVLENGDSF